MMKNTTEKPETPNPKTKGKRTMITYAAIMLAVIGVTLLALGLYIPAKGCLAQVLLNQAWSEAKTGEAAPKPWPWADTYPVAKLRVPRLGASALILSGASGRTMAFGPGHLIGSTEPGAIGHSIVAAHRDTHFAFLKHIVHGDRLVVERPNGDHRTYWVRDRRVMNADRDTLGLNQDRTLLTLVTCYPFDAITPGGPLRYVVTAEADRDDQPTPIKISADRRR